MRVKVNTDFGLLVRLKQKKLVFRKKRASYQLGFHSSFYKGRGLEFAEYKEYSPGDPIKFVDWRVYAKTERLYSRLFSEERRVTIGIALDLTGSMFFRLSKITNAWNLAVGLAYLACLNRDKVVFFLGNRPIILDSIDQLINFTKTIELVETPNFFSNLNSYNSLKYPSLLYLISDFFEPIEKLEGFFNLFGKKQFETVALQTLISEEIRPNFEKWGAIKDIESGEEKPVNRSMLDLYINNFNKHTVQLSSLCARRGVRFVRFFGNTTLDEFFKILISQNLVR